MEFVAINNGYYNTKVKTSNKEFVFASTLRKAETNQEANIFTNGIGYVVGDGAHDINLDKDNDVQKGCIRYAMLSTKCSNVVSALPINTYRNKLAREKYKDVIHSLGATQCEIFMEGAAAIYSDFSYYKNKLVALMDIGGLTINCVLIDDGKVLMDSAFSIQACTLILRDKIKKYLEQTQLRTIRDEEIKYMLKDQLVRPVLEEYSHEISQELKRAKYPSHCQYRCTGGGAITFKDLFELKFNAFISEAALFENVRGLYEFGRMMFA